MKKHFSILTLIIVLVVATATNGQTNFNWPSTPASNVAQEFIKAYNSGNEKDVETFVLKHYWYSEENKTEVNRTVEDWADLFHRYGPIKPHSISIDEDYDIEVWMECYITKNWFAPEFILNEQTKKIRATGLLEGEQPKNVVNPSKDINTLLQLTENYLNENSRSNLFQGDVLLQLNQETIYHKAFGSKNIDSNISNSVNTRMRISSITKPITVIACLQLIQNGYLELDKPISNYLSELPTHISDKITIRSLVMHTSDYELDGIEGFRKALRNTNSMNEVYGLHLQYLPKWEKYKSFNPKGNYDYSNDSFDLLAIIIEKITGMTFTDYLDKYIFQIAEMDETSFELDGVATPYRYDINSRGLTDYSEYYPYALGKISGAGGLKSTTQDLSKLFNKLYFTEELLDEPYKNLMFSMQLQAFTASNPYMSNQKIDLSNSENSINSKVRNGRSMGLNVFYDTHLSYGHNGTSIGNSAELRYFPKSKILMIVLCNNRSGAQNFFRFFNNHLPNN